MPTTVILSRALDADPARAALEQELTERCLASGLDVIVTPHLYHVADDSVVWDRLREVDGPVVLLTWLHPRPAEWLARHHGVGRGGLRAYALSAYDTAAACFGALASDVEAGGGSLTELDAAARERWYPVVDEARCVNCGHCLQFCLFGVHALDAEGRVRVTLPDNCKPGCPACSRICPEGAIIFPLYAKDDAIAGAPGMLMRPDAAARKMYYQRTGATCPQCGGGATPPAKGISAEGFVPPVPMKVLPQAGQAQQRGAERCQECGRTMPAPQPATGRAASPVQDELDALIDELDALNGSGQ